MVGPSHWAPALRGRPGGLFAVEALALTVAVGGALVASPALTLAALLGGAVAGALAPRIDGVPARAVGVLARGLVAVVLAAAGGGSVAVVAVVAAAVAAVTCADLVADVIDARTRGLRRHPASRGVRGVGSVPLLGRPPAVLTALLPEVLLLAPVVLVPGRTATVVTGAVAAVLVAGAVLARWGALLVRARRRSRAVLADMRRYLTEEKPPVLLYAGDGPQSLHEITVWLPTMERLSSRVVLLMRSREALAALPPTSLPVLCVPGATDLFTLPVHEFRVALFVSNIGNNIHLLRVPGLRSAFIGHGDSDKSASANPYSRVYDEIWVAGQAGRNRYLRAGVGVRPEALVEVGRPQIEGIRRGPVGAPVPTLLYAPTWEGWNAEQDYSSVATHGPALVRAVLASSEPIRLLYRPHPYTGRRSAAAAAADREIVALMQAANETAGVTVSTVLTAEPASGTALASAAAEEDAAVRAGEQRLRDLPPTVHVVCRPGATPLVSCFNVASGLITDVSSVLTDFLAADRPVGVCVPSLTDPEDFRVRFPSAAAGTLLTPEAAALQQAMEVLTGRTVDPAASGRAAVRRLLMGPEQPPALQRFDAAVAALARPAPVDGGRPLPRPDRFVPALEAHSSQAPPE